MNHSVDPEVVDALLDSAAAVVQRSPRPAAVPPGAAVDRQRWEELAGLGWTSLLLPEALGGSGLPVGAAAALCEVLGRARVREPLVAAAMMPSALLMVEAPRSQAAAERIAELLLSGERLPTLGWQTGPGQLEPREGARFDGSILHGRLWFVPAVEPDGLLLAWAHQEGQPALVLADLGGAGVRRRTHTTAVGSLTDLELDGAPSVMATLCEGDAARAALDAALCVGSICTAAWLAGLASGALGRTVEYLNQRKQFGRAIASFQTIQHRCVDLHIALQLADASWRHAASTLAWCDVAAAKARANDVALQVTRASIQMHGAIGFTREGGIGEALGDALALSAWLGSSSLQRARYSRLSAAQHEHV